MNTTVLSGAFLERLGRRAIHSKRAFLGARQGIHKSLRKGHGIEFADYRKYSLGDNPRQIDWGVYARSDRLYVKQFREEENLTVLVAVDGSNSMLFPFGDRKWSRVEEIALSLSYVTLMNQDSLSLAIVGGSDSSTAAQHLSNLAGGPAYHRVAALLAQRAEEAQKAQGAQEAQSSSLYNDLRATVTKMRFPGKAIFISDFLYDLEEIDALFNILIAKNLDIAAIQILGDNDIEPLKGLKEARVMDSEHASKIEIGLSAKERKKYTELLKTHTQAVAQLAKRRSIQFVSMTSKEALEDVVFSKMISTGVFR